MDYIKDLLTELTARLPELEWKISGLSVALSNHSLPKGLFRPGVELTGHGCVQEIKADINALSIQNNQRSAHFLAERINHKINVLVALCQMDSRKNKPEEQLGFGVTMLSTRQQWIQMLEKDITTLVNQQQAMTKALQQMNLGGNTSAILTLQSELGEVEKRLTLARETLNQAVL